MRSEWRKQSDEEHATAMRRVGKFERERRKKRFRKLASNTFTWVVGIILFSTLAIGFYFYTNNVWTTTHCFGHELFNKQRLGLISDCPGEVRPTLLLLLMSLFFAIMACMLLIGAAMCLRGLALALLGKNKGMELATDALSPLIFGLIGATLNTMFTWLIIT